MIFPHRKSSMYDVWFSPETCGTARNDHDGDNGDNDDDQETCRLYYQVRYII